MPHLTPGPSHALHGVTFTRHANSATGAARLAGWTAEFAPHTPGQAHTMSEEELLHVLAGSLDVEVGDDRFTARAGDSVLVPAGSPFRVSNDADEPARAFVATTLGMTATMSADGSTLAPPWAQ